MMKKLLIVTALFAWSYIANCQEPTAPEIVGATTGGKMSVSFPFDVVGVPFSAITNSVWNAESYVVAEVHTTYYMEGDATRYGNRSTKKVKINGDGKWRINGLSVEPHPYPIEGKKVVPEKTQYSLFIYQLSASERSTSFNAMITRRITKIKKITSPNQKLEPVISHAKEMKRLNPQPIPPKENFKRAKM